jgi:orotate phosphoribosyltransferase
MDQNLSISRQVVSYLLDINAIKINLENPYTWASGWKSPIYCDNRLSLSFPDIRKYIKMALKDKVTEKFGNVGMIAGVATAGIPQGVLVADSLGLPFLYVRSKPKGHGLTNRIEGRIMEGAKVVVIEDLVSTGGSSIAAVAALREAGMNVLGMISIFTYGFDISHSGFEKEKIPFHSLSNYEILLEVALERKYILAEQIDQLKKWRTDPAGWQSGPVK